MELFLFKWLAMAFVQLMATMSPGPAFVVSVRNATLYDRRTGVFTALGLALGVGVHVLFVLGGLSFIITQSVFLYSFIKYAGAAYLVYIGVKSLFFTQKKEIAAQDSVIVSQQKTLPCLQAFRMGLLTNMLNPKAVVFFIAVFSQFIDPATPVSVQILYGITSVVIEFLWFSGVAVVLTHEKVKQKFMRMVHWIERGCGGLMIALGLKLALSR